MMNVSGITKAALARKLELPYRTFELEAARHEHQIGRPVRLGHAYVYSLEQADQLEALIRADREVQA